jgi:hypothetical protein
MICDLSSVERVGANKMAPNFGSLWNTSLREVMALETVSREEDFTAAVYCLFR